MDQILAIPGILLINVTIGRIGSIPFGVSILDSWYLAALIIIAFDFLQILFFNFVYGLVSRWEFLSRSWRVLKIRFKKFLKRARIKKALKKERKFHSRMLLRAQQLGPLGVVIIAAIPFVGGGMWSGVLLARLLKLNKVRAAILLMAGSVLSCLMLGVGVYGLKEYILRIVNFLLTPGLSYSF